MSKGGRFTVVIPIHNQFESASEYLESWFSLSKSHLDVIFIDNGSRHRWEHYPDVERWRNDGHLIKVIRNDHNIGVYPTFEQGKLATNEYWTFYSHSDVEMLVPGWDERLRWLLEMAESQYGGVCGMFGAKGIGTPDIYKSQYDFRQMMRWDCYTVPSMVDASGKVVDDPLTRCMVLDGFSLILSRSFMKALGEFDHKRYPVHHMYDNDICLESHYLRFNNFVLDLDCRHHGGMTSTKEKWAEKMGTTDLEIHRAAHKVFYEKWRGKLPVCV